MLFIEIEIGFIKESYMLVRGIWKLHGIDSVTGKSRSANNATFYETYQEALDAARSYCARQSNPCPGIVIFKAHTLVKPVNPPIVELPFDGHQVPDTYEL